MILLKPITEITKFSWKLFLINNNLHHFNCRVCSCDRFPVLMPI